MANLTKEELRNRVLQHIGVLAAGEQADPNDALLVDEAIDVAFDQLTSLVGLTFRSTATPPWAQTPIRNYVAALVADTFGLDEARVQRSLAEKKLALAELRRQFAPEKTPYRVKATYY